MGLIVAACLLAIWQVLNLFTNPRTSGMAVAVLLGWLVYQFRWELLAAGLGLGAFVVLCFVVVAVWTQARESRPVSKRLLRRLDDLKRDRQDCPTARAPLLRGRSTGE